MIGVKNWSNNTTRKETVSDVGNGVLSHIEAFSDLLHTGVGRECSRDYKTALFLGEFLSR